MTNYHDAFVYPLAGIKADVPESVQRWLEYRRLTFTDVCCLTLVRFRRAPGTTQREFTLIDVSSYVANGLHYLPRTTTPALAYLRERNPLLTKPVERAVFRHLRKLGLLPNVDGTYSTLPAGVDCPELMAHTQHSITNEAAHHG